MRKGSLLVGVGAVAAAARLPHVWSDSLWQDEVASARILREPTFPAMLHRVVHTESTPPLWYSLGWLLHAAGASILDVRLLSVAAGAATAALVVVLALEVMPLRLAVVAGLLAAFGRAFLAHGHELRAYALLAFACVAFAWALARRDPVAIAVCTAAGVLTHYFFFFTLLAGCVWIVSEPELRGRRRALGGAVAVGLLVTSPWLPEALVQYRQDRFWWIGPFAPRAVVETPFKLFAPSLPLVASLAFLALCSLGAVQLWRTSARGRLYVLLAAGPLVAAASAWAAGLRIYAERNLIGIGPFVALLAAAALAQLPQHARAAAVTAAAAAIALGFSFGTTTPFAGIAHTLVREGWRRGDPIAVFGGMPGFFSYRSPLEWYLPRQPELAYGLRTHNACSTVFAVVHSRAHARRLTALGDVESRWIDGYDVLRLRLRGWPDEQKLGRPTLITAARDHARCVAPVLSGRLKPLA